MPPHIVYLAQFPNGKAYVGITSCGLKERWRQHCKEAKQQSPFRFHRAIRKYGAQNVRLSVLAEGGRKAMLKAEIREISRLRSANKKFGYNASFGGASAMHTPGVAAKVSATIKRRLANDPAFAERQRLRIVALSSPEVRAKANATLRSDEGRARMSETCSRVPRTKIWKKRIAAALKGKPKSDQHRTNIRLAALAREAKKRDHASSSSLSSSKMLQS